MIGFPLLALLAAAPAGGVSAAGAPAPQAATAPDPGGRAWTLPQVLAESAQRQPDVRDARLRAGEARGDLQTAGLIPNPELQLGLSNMPLSTPHDASWSGVLVWGVGLSEEVELGGKRGKRKTSAEAGLSASEHAVRDVVRTSRFDIQKAFLQALWAQERQRLASESLARSLEGVKLVQDRFAAGEDAGADVNKAELEKERYVRAARDAARAAVEARAELFRVTGLSGDAERDRVEGGFSAPAPVGDVDALVQRALAERPDLAALAAASDKARADLALARAQAVPDLTVGLAYAYSPTEVPSGATSTLGVSASLPLPIFGRNQGEVQKAELEVERTRLALERGKADAAREVRLAAQHLQTASAAVDELEHEYLARADKALQVAERSYREGKASLLEFLEAQRTDLETRADYADALLERGAGALELERAVGTGASP